MIIYVPPSHRSLTSKALIERFYEGEFWAYDALVAKHYDALLHELAKYRGWLAADKSYDVEDLANEVMAAFWEALYRRRVEPERWNEGYLLRIARRKAGRRLHAGARRQRALRAIQRQIRTTTARGVASESAEHNEEKAVLWRSYSAQFIRPNGLEPEEKIARRTERRVFRLWLRGLSCSAIAKKLDDNRSRIWRVLCRVQVRLQRHVATRLRGALG